VRIVGKTFEILNQKSIALIGGLHRNLQTIVVGWIVAMSFACGLRLAFSATHFDFGWSAVFAILPYILVIAAPVATLFLLLRIFPAKGLFAQPEIRLARYGKWRELDCLEANSHPLFGTTGMMASLVIGMLINVPFRSVEFLMGIPALGSYPPLWFSDLFAVMAADLVIMNCLYVAAFVMAIRHVPWFPRFLLLVWGLDVCSQLAIAQMVAAIPNVPVAVEAALSGLLTGNLQKVMISAAIWLPYLLLSDRVNLTYRRRVRVG
jgi:hypothetical protein